MKTACLVVPLLVAASGASAQIGTVFSRAGSGARAAGMGNAFVAVSDDGTAASWNPAGLAQLRKPELSLVSTSAGRTFAAEGFRSRDDLSTFTPSESSFATSYLDFGSLAVPFSVGGRPVTVQAAWRRLYTLDMRENGSTLREPLGPDGPPPLRITGNSDLVGSVDLFSLAGAVKLSRRFAVGGAANFWRGDWSVESFASETRPDASAPPRFGHHRQQSRIRGETFAAGLLLTDPRWSAGVVYQTPLDSSFDTTIEGSSSDEAPSVIRHSGRLHFARAYGFGGAFRPTPGWTVALDLTWDEWRESTLEETGQPPINFFDSLPPERTATRDTLSINAGAERLIYGDGFVVPIRFGAAWEPQGARNPYTRDGVDFAMLALGTGYNTNSLKFDAAAQYRWAHFRDGGAFGVGAYDPMRPEAVGDRTAKEWRVKISVIVRIIDTEKLRDVARRVFGDGGT